MSSSLDAALVFGFLSFFHFWGGAALGAGFRERRALPALWGMLIGGAPLYLGVERGTVLGEWGGLGWQILVLAASALLTWSRLPRLRALFMTQGMNSLTVGTFIMAAGAVAGAWLFRLGSEFWSLVAGGIGFLFGAMWFGAGIKQMRGK